MSLYGEPTNQFRQRPNPVTLGAFSLFCTVIGAATGPVFFSIARTLATRSLRADYVFNVHAPVGANPSLGLFPLHSDEIVIGSAVAAGAVALLTTLFVIFYPASQKLANRLAIYSIASAVVAFGAIATIADLGLARSLARWKELSEAASMGTLGGVCVALLLIVVWFERRTISVLGNLFDVDTPPRRLLLWTLRIPVPWGVFGALCLVSGWHGGFLASAAVILLTFIDDLVHYPALVYESLERPKMVEGLTAALIGALILFGGSTWLFGLPGARLAPRALVVENGSVAIVPVVELTRRIQEDTMPRIDMRWSKEK